MQNPDKLTDRAKKTAIDIINAFPFKPYVDSRECHRCLIKVDEVAAIIERNMREENKENHIRGDDFEPMAFASWRNHND